MIAFTVAALLASDPTLDALDAAYASLRAGNHTPARTNLERATRTFDDLTLDGSALEKAFASDAAKPYRGRPHERVLSEALLAALDIERGRCDLALPALKQAVFLDVKQQKTDVSDAVLVHALTLRCLVTTHASDTDVARARADLQKAAGAQAQAVEQLVLADDATLALDGEGPTMRADGADEERAVWVPSPQPSPSGVLDVKPEKRAVFIRIGPHRSPPVKGLLVWSSTTQASTVQGRPFDAVLKERAQFRSQSLRDGDGMIRKGVTTAAARLDVKHAVAAMLFAGAGAGLTVAGAATDARADTRCVDGLFERVVLMGTAR